MILKYLRWAVLAWLLAISIPTTPMPGGAGVDASWIWGLNLAHQQKLEFGRDIVFTYGPLGHLNVPIFPEASHDWFAAYALLIWCTTWYACFRIREWWLQVLFAVCGLTLSLFLWDHFEVALVMLAASIIHRFQNGHEEADRKPVVLLAALVGLAGLLRIHQFVLGCALLAFVLWRYVAEKRLRWLAPLVTVAVFTGLWILQHQSLQEIPGYFHSQLELSSGFAEAMASVGPSEEIVRCVVAIAVLAGLSWWAGGPLAMLPALVVALIAFKHGAIRQDAHMAGVHLKFALAGLLAWAASRRSPAWWMFGLYVAVNLTAGIYFGGKLLPAVEANFTQRLKGVYPSAYLKTYLDLDAFERFRTDQRVSELAVRRLDGAGRQLIGNASVDIYPHNIDVVPANGLRWSPRPVFQSYSAYSPYLDGLNAAHYRSPRRPDKILLHWEPFDGRHPFLDDPLTWREMLDRYQWEGNSSQGAILTNVESLQSRSLQETSLGGVETVGFDQWMEVPARGDGLIALKATVEPSLWGRLTTVALRAVPVRMVFEFERDGGVNHRAIRANLVSGVIVDPMPESLDELVALFQGKWVEARRVKRVKFVTDAPGRYQQWIAVQWVKLGRPERR